MDDKNEKWQNLIFLQGEEAEEALSILDEYGEEEALKYLLEMADGGGEIYDSTPWGTSDNTYSSGGVVMTYNPTIGYIGISKRLDSTLKDFEASGKQVIKVGMSDLYHIKYAVGYTQLKSYEDAENIYNSSKTKNPWKKLAPQTFLGREGNNYIVKLYATPIITYKPGDIFILNSGGYRTDTTKDRINRFSPATVWQTKWEWHIYNTKPDEQPIEFKDGIELIYRNGYVSIPDRFEDAPVGTQFSLFGKDGIASFNPFTKLGVGFPNSQIPTVDQSPDDDLPPMEWTVDSESEEELSEEELEEQEIDEEIDELGDEALEEVKSEFGIDIDKRLQEDDVDEDSDDDDIVSEDEDDEAEILDDEDEEEDRIKLPKKPKKPSDAKEPSMEVF
jgi:hypothetical protein